MVRQARLAAKKMVTGFGYSKRTQEKAAIRYKIRGKLELIIIP